MISVKHLGSILFTVNSLYRLFLACCFINIENDPTFIMRIPTKCYTGSVSNSAVQEIVAGMKYYSCQRGVVVTNSTFTKAAIELARKNTIQLWARKILEEKISEIF